MSSAADHSPKLPKRPADPPAETSSLKTPPPRPALVPPPRRPVKPPVEILPEPESAPPVEVNTQVEPVQTEEDPGSRYQPIAPPSEPMQYRAIGLIRGVYTPEEDEQFNRGTLTTDDGTAIEAVLLGRVTSLVKKHLDLADPHLWVVYPRTRQAEDENADQSLHVQIVGVWEPETLGLPGETVEGDGAESEEGDNQVAPDEASVGPKVAIEDLPPVNENYFSIRGEVVHYDEHGQVIIVKILQGMKRPPASRKAFRLMVQGTLQGRTIGYFWDLNVKRDAKVLVLDQGSPVGIVPPRKRKGGPGGPGGPRRSGPPRRGPGGPGGPGGKRPFSPRGAVKDRYPSNTGKVSEMPKRRES